MAIAENDEHLRLTINKGLCPDCGYRGFIIGPQGGLNTNIECGNIRCRARFNVATYGSTIFFAERIPKLGEGGVPWMTDAHGESE